MKHPMFTAALGLLALVLFAPLSPSFAGLDPSGIWSNDDGSAKMEVKKCGAALCSKIVWLRDPTDQRGKALHDARNENVSLRNRPIIGMPLFIGMNPVEQGVWVGSVYNPEEGHVYTDVKVTLVSHSEIVLRGCKAWLLCGEKSWTRSALPPGYEEVKTTPAAKPQSSALPRQQDAALQPPRAARGEGEDETANAAPEPAAGSEDASSTQSLPRADSGDSAALDPELPPPGYDARHGYGVITTTALPESPAPYSGRDATSLFVMTPVALEAEEHRMASASNAPPPRIRQPRMASTRTMPILASKPKSAQPETQDADAGDVVQPAEKARAHPKAVGKVEDEENEAELPWMQRP